MSSLYYILISRGPNYGHKVVGIFGLCVIAPLAVLQLAAQRDAEPEAAD